MKTALRLLPLFFLFFLLACSSQFNKGVTNKKELRAKKPPSVVIKEEYDRQAKRANRGKKTLKGKEGRNLEKAQAKMKAKKMKKDKRYLKRLKRRQSKK